MKPGSLCLSHDNKCLFVTDRENHVKVLNRADGTLIQKIGNGHGRGPGCFLEPVGVCISPDGSELYVADRYNNRINVFNPIDGSYVCRLVGKRLVGKRPIFLEQPKGICISADGELLYVADNNGVQVLRAGNSDHIRTINVDDPLGLCLSHDNELLFVIMSRGDIVVFRTLDDSIFARFDRVLHRLDYSRYFADICLSPNGKALYVIDGNYDRVRVLRTKDGSLIQTIGEYGQTAGKFTYGPGGICVSPDGEMFVTDNNHIQVFQM